MPACAHIHHAHMHAQRHTHTHTHIYIYIMRRGDDHPVTHAEAHRHQVPTHFHWGHQRRLPPDRPTRVFCVPVCSTSTLTAAAAAAVKLTRDHSDMTHSFAH
eukprot:GHVU01148450.1.p1 GENE.GHVU01148450.1~~GHVU01148450.1.p1  ORF type:complete len:102 (+),score=5.16 GHVU01148450.1:264-569(+)